MISPTPNDSPIDDGFDLDLFRLFGTAGGQRQTAGWANTLRFGYFPEILAFGQMAIIAPFGSRPARPLTAGLRLWSIVGVVQLIERSVAAVASDLRPKS